MRACQSGTENASLPRQSSPPQQRGVLQKKKRAESQAIEKQEKRDNLQREQARQADETWRSPASISMGLDHGHALEPSGWGTMHTRGVLLVPQPTECQGVQQSVSYCAPFLLGHVLCCNECCIASRRLMQHASQLPHHSKTQTPTRGRERQQKHAFLYVRKLTQHCMSARSHIPSTGAFAACHVWANMHRCPQTGYSFPTHRKARMPEQTNHRHRTIRRAGKEVTGEEERRERGRTSLEELETV